MFFFTSTFALEFQQRDVVQTCAFAVRLHHVIVSRPADANLICIKLDFLLNSFTLPCEDSVSDEDVFESDGKFCLFWDKVLWSLDAASQSAIISNLFESQPTQK